MILIFETAMLGVIMVLFGLKRLTTDNVILTFFAVIKRKPIRTQPKKRWHIKSRLQPELS